ncbi:MAG: T9SS type A sorting domain-containing protein [Bacteroidales bacterium]
MKTIIILFLVLAISILTLRSQEQQFLWAQSYEVSNCNEVAAIATDTSENIILAGVHEGGVFVPYRGNIYILKTDPEGNTLWTANILGDLIMGDLIAVNEEIILVGQATGALEYNDIQYGSLQYYLFAFKFDSNGNVMWFFEDESKLGTYANLSVGEDNTFLLHARTQSNLGDWIMIMNMDGTIENSRLLSPSHTLIRDAAYYNGNVYLNGQLSGLSGVTIDTLYIPQSPLESTAFVLALDENLTGAWLSIDTTLNNGAGRIAADFKGVFAYQETMSPPFNIVQNLKKFNFNGELIKETEIPTYAPTANILPEIALTNDRIALFNKNSFSTNNYIVLIYDKELELLQEKVITGPSDPYSNQITSGNQNFYISHVHSGTLNLNDEISLAYIGSGLHPYIAKIGETTTTKLDQNNIASNGLSIYPNPARDKILISYDHSTAIPVKIEIFNLSGRSVLKISLFKIDEALDIRKLDAGIYVLKSTLSDGNEVQQKLIIR